MSRFFRRLLLFYLGATLLLSLVALCVSGAAGLWVLVTSLVLGGLFLWYLNKQEKRIMLMSERLDEVLHNEEGLYPAASEEGALAVLESELVKMTGMIRVQNETLRREKLHLAQSLSDIAHQLRTPLTSVVLLHTFIETSADGAERRELLQEAGILLDRMDALLTALLKLSRLDAGVVTLKRERLHVNDWVDRALQPLQIPMELHGVRVVRMIPPDAAIDGDIVWLSEALGNILKNCMEHAGASTPDAEASIHSVTGGCITISCETNPIYTQLTVRDSGEGFDEESLEHLFERFYRGSKGSSTGFGIGLHLAKTVINRQGGLLMAANHPEGGAVFTLKFYR